MRVYIANFGGSNWAWPECLKRSEMAVMDDERVHSYWKEGNRNAYIAEAQKVLRSAAGNKVTASVASRWFNLNEIFHETVGDIWVHREKDELWWTTSLDSVPTVELRPDPQPTHGSKNIYVYFKKVSGWSDRSKSGQKLSWNGLHAKARDFLSTESTYQKLSSDFAAYTLALIDGADLSGWHSQSLWYGKAERAGRGAVTQATALHRTAVRMSDRALTATNRSGQEQVVVTKAKEFGFIDKTDMERYLESLLEDSEKLCALTGLPMLYDGEDGDPEMRASLDRIDSSRGYTRGNLQIVCWFANRWKGTSSNGDFLRLIQSVQDA